MLITGIASVKSSSPLQLARGSTFNLQLAHPPESNDRLN